MVFLIDGDKKGALIGMEKRGFLLLAVLMLLGFSTIEVNRHVPPEVAETAEENYQEFLSFVINDGNPEDWTIGQFVSVHQLVIDHKLNLAIKPLDEWVAPVLYNGAIIGSMSVYEPSEGRYEIAEFGFSKSFSPSKLKHNEYFLSNRQYDFEFGYAPFKDSISPLGEAEVRLFEEWGADTEGISKKEFEVLIKKHLKDKYPDRFPEKTPVTNYYLLALIPITLIALTIILLAVVLRKNKRSEEAG